MDVLKYFIRSNDDIKSKAMNIKENRFYQDINDEDAPKSIDKKKRKKPWPKKSSDGENSDEDDDNGEDIAPSSPPPRKKAAKGKGNKKEKKKKKKNEQEVDIDVDDEDNEEEGAVIRPIITEIPAILPEYVTEYNVESNQDMREYNDSGMRRRCKLCDFGDNGTTNYTTEVLKELFSMDKKLFRKVPDQVIWRLMCEKWKEKMVIPNKNGYGIDIELLTESEVRLHYTMHDLSNIQRILWNIITFYIRSINYLMNNGGIWQERSYNGMPETKLRFNLTNYKCFDKLVNKMMRLTELSEKLELRERSAADGSSTRSGRPPMGGAIQKFKKKETTVFTPY
jgi:hypothetical protein